jgi:hypothetical protein
MSTFIQQYELKGSHGIINLPGFFASLLSTKNFLSSAVLRLSIKSGTFLT